ncbi:MAG: IS4 family transposase [Ignavibacteriales bacterium]|nr:IS4 family transposase [Ignavibacteriales bacterium]
MVLQQHSKLLNLLTLILPHSIDDKDKFSTNHFSRKRIFTIDFLTFCIIYLISDQNRFGYKHILQTIWKKLRELGLAIITDFGPTAAAFCKARKKLPAKIIKDMFYRVVDLLNKFKPQYLWKGHRLFAIDGMKIQLPYSEELRNHFKCPQNQQGEHHYPQALISKLFCVLTDVVYDFEVAPYDSSERELALLHLDRLRPSDIVIEDRGYPSYEMFWEHIRRQIDFVMRMKTNANWTIIKEFLRTGKKDQIVTINITPTAKKRYQDDPTVPESLTLRLIRITLNTGETEVLVTSLLDMEQYQYEDFQLLYHWRWPIEEANRSAKHHQFLEKFHAKNMNGILQEINAHYLLMAITRLFMLQAEAQTPERIYGLSYKSAVDFVSAQLPILFLSKNNKTRSKVIYELLNMISNMHEKTRPDRSFPRQVKARRVNRFPLAICRAP